VVYLTRNGEEKLYFILEMKGRTGFMDLRTHEQLKIHCGKKHFESLANGDRNAGRDKLERGKSGILVYDTIAKPSFPC
jgi:restriction endonuclease